MRDASFSPRKIAPPSRTLSNNSFHALRRVDAERGNEIGHRRRKKAGISKLSIAYVSGDALGAGVTGEADTNGRFASAVAVVRRGVSRERNICRVIGAP